MDIIFSEVCDHSRMGHKFKKTAIPIRNGSFSFTVD
jgi:hypothetical protein